MDWDRIDASDIFGNFHNLSAVFVSAFCSPTDIITIPTPQTQRRYHFAVIEFVNSGIFWMIILFRSRFESL
ncbi:hypothetical protein HZS_34 [Henneguya salminicola]|nr:hypothetical protein HZS_34 [Henneguya salminicola]